MNGYTEETPLKTRLHNLANQIPPEFRADILAQCIVNDNPHDFGRYLTSAVIRRVWEENAVEQAYQIETERQDACIKSYFGGVKVTASSEWRKRHL